MQVRTRFAPSPTGYLHVGGARTALFCWLYARRFGGDFVLRIEDTDLERSTEAARQAILESMQWLGLDYDEGPVYQSERFERYREVLQQLLDDGQAYRCYCSKERVDAVREALKARGLKPRYDGHCRDLAEPVAGVTSVVRLRSPLHGEVVFDDLVFGRIAVSNEELDDLVLARADGSPTYNFTVVVDDHDMAITHVIRGDDHINNTPRQINILRALNAPLPRYAHVPMILGVDGTKLSKRHGAVSVMEYPLEGYLPEALLNYLVRLGWSHGDQEIFDTAQMIELFDLVDVNRAASVFNPDKLRWLNQHYVKQADTARLEPLLAEQLDRLAITTDGGPPLAAVVEALRERAPTMADMAAASTYFYADFAAYDEKAARKHLKAAAVPVLEQLLSALSALQDWAAPALHAAVVEVAETLDVKLGKVAQPLRVALSGSAATPPIDVTLELVGRARTLGRISDALAWIHERAEQAPES